MKAPTPSDRSLVAVREEDISRSDILLGRGGKTNHHPGNASYLKMIELRQLEYMQLGSRAAKTAYAMHFVRELRDKGIRFLKRDPKAKKIWRDVGDTKMREKVSQNLREHQPELRKQLAEELEQQKVLEQGLREGNLKYDSQATSDASDDEERPRWEVDTMEQQHLREPYARLPRPYEVSERYGEHDERYNYIQQHGTHHTYGHSEPRQLPMLDMPHQFHNHSIEADAAQSGDQAPMENQTPEPPSDIELDMNPMSLEDFDPIPLDEALAVAQIEDDWSPGAVEALRKRSFADHVDAADDDQQASDSRQANAAAAESEHPRKRRSPSDEVEEMREDTDIFSFLPPGATVHYPSFHPPPGHEPDHEPLFEPIGDSVEHSIDPDREPLFESLGDSVEESIEPLVAFPEPEQQGYESDHGAI